MAKHQFNTVASAAMKILNALDRLPGVSDPVAKEGISILLRLLYPITPHISHQLWRDIGFGADILTEAWPEVAEDALVEDEIELVLQVNGKLRGNIQVPASATQDQIAAIAEADENVAKFIAGQPIRKKIVVPGKLVNFVV